jgi:hypothetical protein
MCVIKSTAKVDYFFGFWCLFSLFWMVLSPIIVPMLQKKPRGGETSLRGLGRAAKNRAVRIVV